MLRSEHVELNLAVIEELVGILGEADVITDDNKVEKLSKDFYWYSPVLKEQLEDKRASVVLKVDDLEQLKSIVSILAKNKIPITLRGGGTGNYGQCIPLHGGAVLDLSGMNEILEIKDGVVRAQPGARLGTIEKEARSKGFEFRCLPSTWVISSLGGFLCGGSGGIGSITYGGINNADNVKSVTLLTAEAEPRLVRFEERDSIKALHTYGTTGIMVEIEMRLGERCDYEQMIFADTDWDKLIDWTDKIARDGEIKKRLVTQFQSPIPTYFTPLKKHLKEGHHWTFLLVSVDQADAVKKDAEAEGIECSYSKTIPDPMKPPYLTDYTWNHTTLWAIKSDPEITYLQSGFQPNFKEQMNKLWDRFGDEILFHLEWTAGNSKMGTSAHRRPTGEEVGVGGLPIIRFKSKERLQEIIDYCEEIGVFIANPHTYILEEGGRHPDIEEKHKLKDEVDPFSLLNPGKMKTYKENPFAKTS